MERWGDPELHSYNIGVYDCINKAKIAGQEGKEHRGGKYEAKIDEFTLNDGDGPVDDSHRIKLGKFSAMSYYPARKKERRFEILLYKTTSCRNLFVGLYYFNLSFSWDRK